MSSVGKVTRYVLSGQVITSSKNEILVSSPLGSCVAVIAYDSSTKTGGMAHTMVPGKSPEKKNIESSRYVSNAIKNLLKSLYGSGVRKRNIEICLVGGANVLKREDNTIAVDVVSSIFDIIREQELKIQAISLGGVERRSATIDLKSGTAYFTIGDSENKVLWKFLQRIS